MNTQWISQFALAFCLFLKKTGSSSKFMSSVTLQEFEECLETLISAGDNFISLTMTLAKIL